jgi:hypothetical protein
MEFTNIDTHQPKKNMHPMGLAFRLHEHDALCVECTLQQCCNTGNGNDVNVEQISGLLNPF